MNAPKRDVTSLVVGLLCLSVAVLVLVQPGRSILVITVPIILIVIGLIGLFLIPRKNPPRKEV